MSIIEKNNQEIDRLQCSTGHDPYSGLTVEPDDDGVRIFDDHGGEIYSPFQLLEILEKCQSASLDSQSPENIWQIIAPAEF